MLTKKQLELRKHGLGSSEIAAVCGLSPFRRPMDVWMVKTGFKADFEGNEATTIGSELESWIAGQYCQRTGEVLLDTKPPGTFQHPKYEWALATPDALLLGDKILEIKNVGPTALRYWDDQAADGVPLYVLSQIQWQMFVCDYPKATICALLGGVRIRWWEFERDDKMIDKMFSIAENFWRFNVLADNPPDETDPEYLKILFPTSNGRMLEATNESISWAKAYLTADKQRKEAKKEKEINKNRLVFVIGEHDGIKGVATYKANKKGARAINILYQEEAE